MKLERHVWQLRSQRCFKILEIAFYFAAKRVDARIAQFSVQHDHVHMLVEARDLEALARAMQGFEIRVAKALNKLMGKKGRVFADRYHSRPLHTPTEVRRCLVYVLNNGRKHEQSVGFNPPPDWLDPFSSAIYFIGWTDPPRPTAGPLPIQPAQTWLLATGWRERGGGPLRRSEAPAHH
jgi:hypothetical protein